MKDRIYLFCNKGFGKNFYLEFQSFAILNKKYECIVVFSIKTSGEKGFRYFVKYIKAILDTEYLIYLLKYFKTGGCMPIAVENVNSQKFFAGVPLGSQGFVAGFNQIFSEQLIERFANLINFHPSILPFYRGAIPSYWVLRNNEPTTGFTAHRMTSKIDCGEILYQEIIPVDQEMTENELDKKIAFIAAEYFKECLVAITQGRSFKRKTVESPYKNNVGYVSSKRN